jgi:energy-converting hydrogenase Eha subunit A
MNIKSSQIYDWDAEPVDERPSEFAASTGYSVLSGYHAAHVPLRAPRKPSRVGFKALLVFCVAVLALGVFVLLKIAPLLHG